MPSAPVPIIRQCIAFLVGTRRGSGRTIAEIIICLISLNRPDAYRMAYPVYFPLLMLLRLDGLVCGCLGIKMSGLWLMVSSHAWE